MRGDHVDVDLLVRWLDSDTADFGLTVSARQQLADILTKEDAYQAFANIILRPVPAGDEIQLNKRSWRAMNVLKNDLQAPIESSGLINATRAGLLAKDVFGSLRNDNINLLHTRTLLEALLQAYPSSVISAACAGGKDGMDAHLCPLLSARTSSQTLPIVTHLVLYGCLGKQAQASAEKTINQQQELMMQRSAISQGHRRKFVKSLSDWSFLTKLIECISQDQENESVGEDVSECILTIVECLGYPEKEMQPPGQPPKDPDNLDFIQQLFTPLGKSEWWDPLMANLSGEESNNAKVASTRVMMGIFTLATGQSSRIRKSDVPMLDATENSIDKESNQLDTAARKNLPHENKLKDWGLTSRIHLALTQHLPKLARALLQGCDTFAEGTNATTYFDRGDPTDEIAGVAHPGRCRIVPFTAWRLHAVALFTEILTYQESLDEKATNDDAENLRQTAMTKVMELPLPGSSDVEELNPWPLLCNWVFEYPENALYHFQFIRLFRAVCIEHHESTLRLVLQKAKFVSNAVKMCKKRGPLRGVLVTCLNILRLRLQSLAPSAFLRQFLESHDAWKSFQSELVKITLDQERPSQPIPGKEVMFFKQIGIDLGSQYAAQLGFVGIEAYKEDPADEKNNGRGMKKKKNSKKRKKKKPTNTGPEDEDGDCEV